MTTTNNINNYNPTDITSISYPSANVVEVESGTNPAQNKKFKPMKLNITSHFKQTLAGTKHLICNEKQTINSIYVGMFPKTEEEARKGYVSLNDLMSDINLLGSMIVSYINKFTEAQKAKQTDANMVKQEANIKTRYSALGMRLHKTQLKLIALKCIQSSVNLTPAGVVIKSAPLTERYNKIISKINQKNIFIDFPIVITTEKSLYSIPSLLFTIEQRLKDITIEISLMLPKYLACFRMDHLPELTVFSDYIRDSLAAYAVLLATSI